MCCNTKRSWSWIFQILEEYYDENTEQNNNIIFREDCQNTLKKYNDDGESQYDGVCVDKGVLKRSEWWMKRWVQYLYVARRTYV